MNKVKSPAPECRRLELAQNGSIAPVPTWLSRTRAAAAASFPAHRWESSQLPLRRHSGNLQVEKEARRAAESFSFQSHLLMTSS